MVPWLKWTDVDTHTFEAAGSTARAGRQSVDDYEGHRTQAAFARFLGVGHRVSCAIPTSDHTEVILLIDRSPNGVAFSEHDEATALATAHVLDGLARRWCRHLGVLDGGLLTVRERAVLVCLLRGCSEKGGADELGIKPTYFHQVVVQVYKKLAVASLAQLISKCLTDTETLTSPWTQRAIDVGETRIDVEYPASDAAESG